MPLNNSKYITYGQMNLINDARYHWTQLALWSSLYIICRSHNGSNIYSITQRLHQVPSGFYHGFSMFYGAEIAEQVTSLLNMYIILFRRLVDAQKNKDQQAVDDTMALWQQNINELAGLLARINPYWIKEHWLHLLNEHIQMTVQEAIATFTDNFNEAINIFDRLQYHAMLLADYMARGFMQFLMVEEEQI
jgi:hypothetical protein